MSWTLTSIWTPWTDAQCARRVGRRVGQWSVSGWTVCSSGDMFGQVDAGLIA